MKKILPKNMLFVDEIGVKLGIRVCIYLSNTATYQNHSTEVNSSVNELRVNTEWSNKFLTNAYEVAFSSSVSALLCLTDEN